MPIAKNPILRYRILNSCFTHRQKRYWTMPELIAKLCDHDLIVDKRTLERDFEAMRDDERLDYHAPHCLRQAGTLHEASQRLEK